MSNFSRESVGVNALVKDPFQRCAESLEALAAPERLKIVRFLVDREHTVTEIAEMLHIPAMNASYHLAVLKGAGLIRGVKRGRFVDYSLEPGVLGEAVEAGIPHRVLNLICCRLEFPAWCEPGDRPG